MLNKTKKAPEGNDRGKRIAIVEGMVVVILFILCLCCFSSSLQKDCPKCEQNEVVTEIKEVESEKCKKAIEKENIHNRIHEIDNECLQMGGEIILITSDVITNYSYYEARPYLIEEKTREIEGYNIRLNELLQEKNDLLSQLEN